MGDGFCNEKESVLLLWSHGLFLADGACHIVQCEAHIAREWHATVLMGPRCKNKKMPLSAGLVVLVPRLGEFVEAPWREENEWQFCY